MCDELLSITLQLWQHHGTTQTHILAVRNRKVPALMGADVSQYRLFTVDDSDASLQTCPHCPNEPS